MKTLTRIVAVARTDRVLVRFEALFGFWLDLERIFQWRKLQGLRRF